MSEDLENSTQSPCSPEADSESWDEDEFEGVYRLDDSVVICGSYYDNGVDFENFCDLWASVVASYHGLPIPRRRSDDDSWEIVIDAAGCTDEVLRIMQDYWDNLLVSYAEWIALGGAT